MEVPILSVTKVNKHFGGLAAVWDLSFDVQAGEVLGLMGPNGAGKSTLLNIISGVYKPAAGTIKSVSSSESVGQYSWKSKVRP